MFHTRIVPLDPAVMLAEALAKKNAAGSRGWSLAVMHEAQTLVVEEYLTLLTIPAGCLFVLRYPKDPEKGILKAVISLRCFTEDGKAYVTTRLASMKRAWLDEGVASEVAGLADEHPHRSIAPTLSYQRVNLGFEVYVRLGGPVLRVPADYAYAMVGANATTSPHELRLYWVAVHVPEALCERIGKQRECVLYFGVNETQIARLATRGGEGAIEVLDEFREKAGVWTAPAMDYAYAFKHIAEDFAYPSFVRPALDYRPKRAWPALAVLERQAERCAYTCTDVRALYAKARAIARAQDRTHPVAARWARVADALRGALRHVEELALLDMTRQQLWPVARAFMQGQARARAAALQRERAQAEAAHARAMALVRKSAESAHAQARAAEQKLAEHAAAERLQADAAAREDSVCALCLEHVALDHAVVPCGHCYCGGCLLQLPESSPCPRCMRPMQMRMQLF